MVDTRGSFAAEGDRQLLLKWAMRYSPHAKYYQSIIERTAMIAASDPDTLAHGNWERNVKALMHRVAQDELLRVSHPEDGLLTALKGARVMVVEDEYLLADELSKTLQASGAELVGPCPDLEAGLTAIEEKEVDVAILDIRLAGEDCFPIADELTQRDIPFVFLSGHERDVLPARYKQARHYLKPMPPSEIPSLISLCLSENRT